jgi:6-phosphofructokinase 1
MKRIAVLTSGGDTPVMNAAIYSVVRTAASKGMTVFGIIRGYAGLIHGELTELLPQQVEYIVNKGGTIIKSARALEMLTEEGQKKAVKTLEDFGIEGLIVIGGDGSFKGARALTHLGVPAVGIPGTIDNDIAYTDYTLGFDTAVSTAAREIDRIRTSMLSHDRICVVEVMGRHCGDVALHVGVASEADYILVPEVKFDLDKVCEDILERKKNRREVSIIVLSEGAGDSEEIATAIKARTGLDVKSNILGYTQRGGEPTVFDRILAMRTGVRAVELLDEGQGGRVVGIRNNKIIDEDIDKALSRKKKFDTELYNDYLNMMNF